MQAPPTPAFPKGRLIRRTFLSLGLQNGQQRLSCYALVDSGADHCVFPRSFMQPLGLDPLTAPVDMTVGVGSTSIPTHFADITLDFGVVQFSVYAGFTTGMDQIGFGLLGQAGFFDRNKIAFDYSQELFTIEPYRISNCTTTRLAQA
jgi:hypothetical protein